MKSKKLLFISLILFLLSCNQSGEKEENYSPKKEKSINTKGDSIISANKQKEFDDLFNYADTVNIQNSKDTDNTNLYTESNTDMVRIGNPKEYYIVDKGLRRQDSINIFTPELMNNRMNNRLISKGVHSKYTRDSIIWDFWQKKIIDNDSTHTYLPFSE